MLIGGTCVLFRSTCRHTASQLLSFIEHCHVTQEVQLASQFYPRSYICVSKFAKPQLQRLEPELMFCETCTRKPIIVSLVPNKGLSWRYLVDYYLPWMPTLALSAVGIKVVISLVSAFVVLPLQREVSALCNGSFRFVLI